MKWSKEIPTLAGLALLGFSLLAGGCDSIFKRNTIEYQVTGSASSVYVGCLDANQTDFGKYYGQELPWSYKFRCDNTHRYLYVEASSGTSGSMTVSIYADGLLLAAKTDDGTYGHVEVDASWP